MSDYRDQPGGQGLPMPGSIWPLSSAAASVTVDSPSSAAAQPAILETRALHPFGSPEGRALVGFGNPRWPADPGFEPIPGLTSLSVSFGVRARRASTPAAWPEPWGFRPVWAEVAASARARAHRRLVRVEASRPRPNYASGDLLVEAYEQALATVAALRRALEERDR